MSVAYYKRKLQINKIQINVKYEYFEVYATAKSR